VVQNWISDPQGRFILVLADFGTGKTFLLYELTRRLADAGEGPVPILLQMRFLEKGNSLAGLLAFHFAEAELGNFSLNKFRYLLEEGLVVLLFDGFDELALRVTYPRAVEHFYTLLEAAAGRAKVVATSRKQHFLTDDQVQLALLDRVDVLPGRRILELLPFTDEQIFQFLLHHS
jgi:predicted NACHT family NTPase